MAVGHPFTGDDGTPREIYWRGRVRCLCGHTDTLILSGAPLEGLPPEPLWKAVNQHLARATCPRCGAATLSPARPR